jgi:hypothetical protein
MTLPPSTYSLNAYIQFYDKNGVKIGTEVVSQKVTGIGVTAQQ